MTSINEVKLANGKPGDLRGHTKEGEGAMKEVGVLSGSCGCHCHPLARSSLYWSKVSIHLDVPDSRIMQVRLQEFLELVKAGDRLEAVRHAKKHLASEEQVELMFRVDFH